MFKSLLLATALMAVSITAASAQGWQDGPGTQMNSTTNSAPGQFYTPQMPNGNNGGSNWGTAMKSVATQSNGAIGGSGGNTYGPNLFGAPSSSSIAGGAFGGGSGAATGAPIMAPIYGSTGFAPSNLALQTQYGNTSAIGVNLNPANMMLPATTLDSFVATSGYNDKIYGDEGTYSEPPYFSFTPDHYIINGLQSQTGLTTGHPSDAPSAWGYPQ